MKGAPRSRGACFLLHHTPPTVATVELGQCPGQSGELGIIAMLRKE